MNDAKCSDCGLTGPTQSFYSLNGKTYCEPCVWKASREAASRGAPSQYVSIGYESSCARCGRPVDVVTEGKTPLCQECRTVAYSWPYPQWLKLSLAFLLILLVISLIHGRKYFVAGKSLYVGEKLVEQHKYEQAIPYLKTTVDTAPQSDKGVLLFAIACLRAGKPADAMRALDKHNDGRFENANDPLFVETNQLAERADRAFTKVKEASDLAQKNEHAEEAAQKMREAAQIYPESPDIALAVPEYEAAAAFESKDYDRFLSISQEIEKNSPNSGRSVAMVASALACKYAVTGDKSFRDRAEQMLEAAGRLSQSSAEEQKAFNEYSERIHYRLTSRLIIDTPEYNRRFRNNKSEKQ